MTNQKKIKICYLESMKKFIENFMYCGDEDLAVSAAITFKSLEKFIGKFEILKDSKDEELVFQKTLNEFMIMLNKKMK